MLPGTDFRVHKKPLPPQLFSFFLFAPNIPHPHSAFFFLRIANNHISSQYAPYDTSRILSISSSIIASASISLSPPHRRIPSCTFLRPFIKSTPTSTTLILPSVFSFTITIQYYTLHLTSSLSPPLSFSPSTATLHRLFFLALYLHLHTSANYSLFLLRKNIPYLSPSFFSSSLFPSSPPCTVCFKAFFLSIHPSHTCSISFERHPFTSHQHLYFPCSDPPTPPPPPHVPTPTDNSFRPRLPYTTTSLPHRHSHPPTLAPSRRHTSHTFIIYFIYLLTILSSCVVVDHPVAVDIPRYVLIFFNSIHLMPSTHVHLLIH